MDDDDQQPLKMVQQLKYSRRRNYTVAPDGTVTFVPEKSFTGTGTGVTVKRVDKNGTPVTANYTPTVTPVTPTAEPATSIGKRSNPNRQTNLHRRR